MFEFYLPVVLRLSNAPKIHSNSSLGVAKAGTLNGSLSDLNFGNALF